MTDTPDPWKDIIGRIDDVASSISPEDDGGALISELGAIVQAIRSESASSDAQTRQQVEDAFQAGFNRGRQEKCDGRH